MVVLLLKSCKNKCTFTKHSASNHHKSSVAKNDLPLIFSENITPLENADELSYEGKVTRTDCLEALKDCKNEKSPGTEGLQAEFYKYFWKELHSYMIRTFNFAYDNGSLSRDYQGKRVNPPYRPYTQGNPS